MRLEVDHGSAMSTDKNKGFFERKGFSNHGVQGSVANRGKGVGLIVQAAKPHKTKLSQVPSDQGKLEDGLLMSAPMGEAVGINGSVR